MQSIPVEDELTQNERRELRTGYRDLLSDATARKKEYLAGDGSLLLDDLKRANSLFDKVDGTSEGVLDSRFLIMSADIGAQRAHQLRIDQSAFDPLEYVDKIRRTLYNSTDPDEAQMSGTQPNWSAVGKIAAQFSRRTPRFAWIYGPLMTTPRQRRKAEGRRQNTSSQAVKREAHIEAMDEASIQRQENQTTKFVQRVHRKLAEVGPINLFELVINPESFAQSVENIFYVSFLIRDGKAFIDDQSGQPMIEACEPPQQDDYQSGLTKKQLIFSLDQPTWQEIIDVYHIEHSIIPTRPSKTGGRQ